MKKLILFITFLFLPLTSFAQQFKLEPLYGYETTRREFPKPANQITKSYLGVNILYGVPLLSLEFEVAQGTHTDHFVEQDLKVKSTTRRAMLGARSYPIVSKYYGWYFRAGMRAKQEIMDITEAGVSRKETDPVYLDPYAGTGITITLGSTFALNAGATLVYNRSADVERESQRYDIQYTLSGSFKVGNRFQ